MQACAEMCGLSICGWRAACRVLPGVAGELGDVLSTLLLAAMMLL